MRTLITFITCLLAVNSFAAPVVVPIGLANPRFGIVSSMSSTDYVAIEIAGKPHGITLANFAGSVTNGSVVTIQILNVTSNVLVTIINATNTALINDLNSVSNYLYGLISTNVTVAAGSNVLVVTNIVGQQTVYTVSGNPPPGGDRLWTNDLGFVHLNTNGPVVFGSNSGPSAAIYQFLLITNDSMNGMFLEYVPKTGSGNNRLGFEVDMGRGDAMGGFASAIYARNLSTTSNGFGPYFGSNPFGVIGSAESAGPGDSVGVIGVNTGTNKTRYGVVGIAGGLNTGNTNIGVFGHGSTNSTTAAGGYFELGNGTATATDAKYPFTSALILNNRQTAQRLLTAFTNSMYEVFALLANGHMQLNSNEVYSAVAGTGITFTTNGTSLTINSSVSGLSGSTNFINLSVQSGKMPTPQTNFAVVEAAWQSWEVLYYKTNAEGSIASLNRTWDFTVPDDYATNSLVVHNWSFIESTNGPNSSNTIWRVSVMRATPGDTTDIHLATFSTTVTGTNTWTASTTGTNKVQDLRIVLGTNSLLMAGDVATLKLERVAPSDTFGGVAALSRLRLEYTRP